MNTYKANAGDLSLSVSATGGDSIQGNAYLRTTMPNNESEIRMSDINCLHDLKYVVESVLRQIERELHK